MKKKKLKIIVSILSVTIIVTSLATCYFTGISVFNNSMQLVDNKSTSIKTRKIILKI